MLGTLNGALEVRGITLDAASIKATARGFNELRDKVPVLTKIEIAYQLRIPPGTRGTVERALERHQSKCPTAQTLVGAVDITWSADIQETGS